MQHTLTFDTKDNWKPMSSACWMECPCRKLIPLDTVCRAITVAEESGFIICPMVIYGDVSVGKLHDLFEQLKNKNKERQE